jgi:hypothetical protein
MVLRGYAARIVVREHHVYYTECGYNNNVDLGMSEKPEQVVE